jgi:hypothetical protein
MHKTPDQKALLREAARRALSSNRLSTAELSRELSRAVAMSNDRKSNAWVRSILIGFAIFSAWLVVGIATYQDGSDEVPTIMALFSR